MVSRQEDFFSRHMVSSDAANKENQQPPANAGGHHSSSSVLHPYKLLERRATVPSFSFEELPSRELRENQGQSRSRRDLPLGVLRNPLATLTALNRNLQKIFHTRISTPKLGEENASLLDDSSDISFVDASQELDLRIIGENLPMSDQEKISYFYPYLQESMQLQVRRIYQVPEAPHLKYQPHLKTTPTVRAAIIDWIFSMQNYFSLPDMIAHVTIQILDCSSNAIHIQEKDLQLAAGAAFWIAAKMEGTSSANSKINGRRIRGFIGKSYTMELLKRAEYKLFRSLNFCIPRDSALSVMHYQLFVLKCYVKVDEELMIIGQFALEAGLMKWTLSQKGQAEIASAATLCACLLSGFYVSDDDWNRVAGQHEVFLPKTCVKESLGVMLGALLEVQGPLRNFPNLKAKYSTAQKRHIVSNPKVSEVNIVRNLRYSM